MALQNRLIQGPLAGVSCAPFRRLFSAFRTPAFCVSEMLSAYDVVHKHLPSGRYLYRSPSEKTLCYQIAGTDPDIMAAAAKKLVLLGADLIDINCGCPKTKIRKKGAGSALLEQPEHLLKIISAVRLAIDCPLTVKIRLPVQGDDRILAAQIAQAGADALIIHGRRWCDDYDKPCDLQRIQSVKECLEIPVIVNGDLADAKSVEKAVLDTGCDGFMLSRASTGRPWIFQELLTGISPAISRREQINLFLTHLHELAELESEHQAVLQSKSLIRYYFRNPLEPEFLADFYTLRDLQSIKKSLSGLSRKARPEVDCEQDPNLEDTTSAIHI